MAARKTQINLLPERGFETTTTGRVLAWILSTFRIIVIVTEIIVMFAFLSRFWLDAQNTDLTEELEQKQAVLVASSDFEKDFKSTQSRLKIFAGMIVDEGLSSKLVQNSTEYLPDDLSLSAIIIELPQIILEGNTPNEQSIQQLVVNLNASELFKEIGITKIKTNSSDPGLLDFQLTGKAKDE